MSRKTEFAKATEVSYAGSCYWVWYKYYENSLS